MLHVFAIVLDGGAKERRGVGVAADKFGRRRKGEIDEIVKDENLAVAIGAGADADGGNGQLGGDGAATSRGTPSSTMAPAPASASARASA